MLTTVIDLLFGLSYALRTSNLDRFKIRVTFGFVLFTGWFWDLFRIDLKEIC